MDRLARQTFHAGQAVAPVSASVSGSVTPDCALSNGFNYTLTGNVAMEAPANPADGQVINIRLQQDASGAHTVDWNAVFKFPGGNPPTLSTAPNAVDLLSAYYYAAGARWECGFISGLG